ncbi:MAG: hypothetical protein ACXWMH_03280 [Syntrophales bacterium]
MKSERGLFVIVIFSMAAFLVIPNFLRNAEAWQGGNSGFEGYHGVQMARGGGDEDRRGGEAEEGPRGGKAVEGPRGNVAAEGPRGNVAVGTRYQDLPDSAHPLIVGDRTYYLDDSGVYYLPCDDDWTVYCVVPAPQ